MAKLTKVETQKTINKLMLVASEEMKNGYSRGDN